MAELKMEHGTIIESKQITLYIQGTLNRARFFEFIFQIFN
jgi:hypothetical protein